MIKHLSCYNGNTKLVLFREGLSHENMLSKRILSFWLTYFNTSDGEPGLPPLYYFSCEKSLFALHYSRVMGSLHCRPRSAGPSDPPSEVFSPSFTRILLVACLFMIETNVRIILLPMSMSSFCHVLLWLYECTCYIYMVVNIYSSNWNFYVIRLMWPHLKWKKKTRQLETVNGFRIQQFIHTNTFVYSLLCMYDCVEINFQ